MSDGQAFYLLMVLLYLYSCVKAAESDSIIIHKRWRKGWALRQPIAILAGVSKVLHCAPLLPWPSSAVVSRNHGSAPQPKISQSSQRRLIELTRRSSGDLRQLSLLLFALIFAFIPYIYYTKGESPQTYAAIVSAFACMLVIGSRYFFLHRRLSPQQPVERWKNLFFCLTMPWHAMRIADELMLIPRLTSISPLMLAAHCQHPSGDVFLAQSLRNAIHRKRPNFSLSEVRATLHAAAIDPTPFTRSPQISDKTDGSHYCPCCHSLFTSHTSYCSECDNLPLSILDEIH